VLQVCVTALGERSVTSIR